MYAALYGALQKYVHPISIFILLHYNHKHVGILLFNVID